MMIKHCFKHPMKDFSPVDFRRGSECERDSKTLPKHISALEYTGKVTKAPLHVLLAIGTPVPLVNVYLLTKRELLLIIFVAIAKP